MRAADNFAAVMGFDLSPDGHADIESAARLALERVVPRDRARVQEALKDFLNGRSVGRIEFGVLGDDRIERCIESIWHLDLGQEGQPQRAFATGLDVTARRRAEETLRESEARYSSALKAGRMGSWETDLVSMTRTWSKEGMALFGLDLADGRGQVEGPGDEYLSALHPEDRHLMQRFHDLADRQDSFPAEYRIVRPDGTMLWLSGRGLVVARGPDGKAQRLVSIMADATERKQAEEELRTERERLSLALRAGQMGVYDLNAQDGVLWWSSQTYIVFGVTEGNFRPGQDSVLAMVHPEDREPFLRRRAEAIEKRRPLVHECRIVRPDGTLTWVALQGQAEYDAEGRVLRSFGIVMDITARKTVEQALREANRTKDDFIATLAHEMRNPLAPMRNAVNVLRKAGHGDPQVAWCRDVIDRQLGQMAHLLDDLLDVARLSRGQFQLRRQPLAVSTIIEQAIEIARPFIDAAGHALTVGLPSSPVDLEGDLTRLAQVFSNLLINAAKYTPARGQITLTVELEGAELVVRVADTGIGIAADQMSHIFDMFAQVDGAMDRSQGGLGIGLSLAKGLVEMHGGHISAHSEGVGKGSEFVVRLPSRRPMHPAAMPGTRAEAGPPVIDTYRILVADDLRDSADSLAKLLQLMGHSVEVAYDGEEALRVAESFRPEVALLDIGMPGLNGFEVCRRMRAQPWGSRMTLIAQTGWGQEEDRRRTREAGFDHHVVKPIDPGALGELFKHRV